MTVLLNGMQVSIEGLFECSYFKLQELLLAIIGLLNEQAVVQGQLRRQHEEDKVDNDKVLAEISAKLNRQKDGLGDRLETLEKKLTGVPDGIGLEQRLVAVEGRVWGATPGGVGGFEQRLSAVESQVTGSNEGAVSFDQRMTKLEDQAGAMMALASQLEGLGKKLRVQMQHMEQRQANQAGGAEELNRWHQLRAQVASLQNDLESVRNTFTKDMSAVIRPMKERLAVLEGSGQPSDGTDYKRTESNARENSAISGPASSYAGEDGAEEVDPATVGSDLDPATTAAAGSEIDPATAPSEHGSACGYAASASYTSTAPASYRSQSGGRRFSPTPTLNQRQSDVHDASGTGGTEPDAHQEKLLLAALHQDIDAAKGNGAMALAFTRKLEDRISELERSVVEGIQELKNKPLRRLDHGLRALEVTVHTYIHPNLKAVSEREAATKAKLAADIKDLRLVVQALEAAGAAGTSRCLSCYQHKQQEQDPMLFGDDGKVYKLRSSTPSEVLSESSWAHSSQRPTSAATGAPRRPNSRANARTMRCKTTEPLPLSGRAAAPTL